MSKAPRKSRAKKAPVVIAEAVGYAGTAGRLGPKIEDAMGQAVKDANALGILDDTRGEVLVDILGDPSWADKIGADYIRDKKLEARQEAKRAHRELEEADRQEREAARLAAEA